MSDDFLSINQLLQMNGLTMDILQSLSYKSRLGIPLRKNLHHFEKAALLNELFHMAFWLDTQDVLYDIALDYRVKSYDSIALKYERYYPDHQVRKVFKKSWQEFPLIYVGDELPYTV